MEQILKQLSEHQNSLIEQLKDAVSQIQDPKDKAEFNRWNAKLSAIHKLPIHERQDALNKILDEFKRYQS
jgi:AAA+ ATPase superfamily predicted ATPase